MPKYHVEVPEVHYRVMEIEAAGPLEAVVRALDGEGSVVAVSEHYHLPDEVSGAYCHAIETDVRRFVELYDSEDNV